MGGRWFPPAPSLYPIFWGQDSRSGLKNFSWTDVPRVRLYVKILFAIKALVITKKNWKNLLDVASNLPPPLGHRRVKRDQHQTKFGLVLINGSKRTEGVWNLPLPQVENVFNRPGEVGLEVSDNPVTCFYLFHI